MTTRSEQAREAIESSTDEARIQRQWRGVQERRAGKRVPAVGRAWGIAGGLAVAAALALAVLVSSADDSLATADGSTLAGELIALDAARGVELDDGSRIELSPGSRLAILDNSGSRISLHLSEGSTHFEVEPGGPRRWLIEAGPLTVEVVGTAFTVTRDGAHASVEVQRGAVIVRGDGVPDRVQRLGPGDRVAVGEPVELAEPAPEPTVTPTAPVASAVEEPIVEAPIVEGPAEPESPRARRARRPRRVHTAAEILARADTARRGGDLATAIALLERIDRERADDPSAGLAAFTLGRIELEQRDDPAAASRAFARAQQLGVPSALEDDVAVRLVEAFVRGGDVDGARDAARGYLEAHPTGRHAPEMRRWASP